MSKSGINMGAVKTKNSSQILEIINADGPISKKDIAEKLGLTPAAVTLLCNDFFDSGLLIEKGYDQEKEVRAGRKKVLIDLNPDYGLILGINIDSAKTSVSVCNIKGKLFAFTEMETNSKLPAEDFLKQVAILCEDLLQNHHIQKDRLLGAGVGIPGVIDSEMGISVHAYGLWKEKVAVCDILERALGLKMHLVNNVNALGIAEIMFGLGKTNPNLLIVKWGPGVGSAIVINSKIYEAKKGKAAELGHFIVDLNGEHCSCGKRGCLETKVSVKALKTKIKDFDINDLQDSISKLGGEELEIWKESVLLFAQAIINVVTLIGAHQVVFYGSMFRNTEVAKQVKEACLLLDESMRENMIGCSPVMSQEDYLGPIAAFLQKEIFMVEE